MNATLGNICGPMLSFIVQLIQGMFIENFYWMLREIGKVIASVVLKFLLKTKCSSINGAIIFANKCKFLTCTYSLLMFSV